MSEQKICSECKNFGIGSDGSRCNRVIEQKIDVVWGMTWVCDQRTCHEIRADEASCGPEGRFFEEATERPAISWGPIHEASKAPKPRKWWHIFA